MRAADINNDGLADLVISSAGGNGSVGYYLNADGTSFAPLHKLDSPGFVRSLATGDFNGDGKIDIAAVGGTSFTIWMYLNGAAGFSPGRVVDNGFFPFANDIEVHDFDNNGYDDMVVIGQHSIDFYRNAGNSSFNKEPILTTANSPRVLECIDMAIADFDNDGDMDILCGETAGLVVYYNDGNGNFLPAYFSTPVEIVSLVHPFDVDADGDIDVMMKNSSGIVKWYSNNGSGQLQLAAVVPALPNCHSFVNADADNDGREDLFVSSLHQVSLFLNDSLHEFSTERLLEQNNALYMDELCTMDVNGNGSQDYIWSGTTKSIAFHLNTNVTYFFKGNGNWSDQANWNAATVPPVILPAAAEIIISPVAGGECLLDMLQTIPPGTRLTVAKGRRLRIPGVLILQ